MNSRWALLFMIVGIAGCAVPSRSGSREDTFKSVTLADIEKLEIGKVSAGAIYAEIGSPSRTLSLSPTEDIWIYSELLSGEPVQRAGLVIDKKTQVLLTATWLPRNSDPIHDRNNALGHFKDARFTVKDIGWIAHHEYSDEATYDDPNNGISLVVKRSQNTVSSISFDLPK